MGCNTRAGREEGYRIYQSYIGTEAEFFDDYPERPNDFVTDLLLTDRDSLMNRR